MKKPVEELEQRRTRHEWECRDAVEGVSNVRRVAGRWQVRRGASWRDLDPAPELGEPV